MNLFALSGTSSGVSIVLVATVVGEPVGITMRSLCLVFSFNHRIVKKYLKTLKKKRKKKIQNIISKGLADAKIDHKVFTIIKNEENKYCKLKENIRMKKSERDNTKDIN